jgi:hypothetical protein
MRKAFEKRCLDSEAEQTMAHSVVGMLEKET